MPAERARIARHFIGEVGLADLEDACPRPLSGGMMQRVTLARALANRRAGRIKERVEINILRPRSVDMLASPEFMAIKRASWR